MSEIAITNQKFKREGAFEKRVHEVDLIRGILILFVIFDHIFNQLSIQSDGWIKLCEANPTSPFSIANLDNFKALHNAMQWYWFNPVRAFVREIVLFGFCFISGLSCAFSRSNWKRAGETIAVGFAVSVICRILNATEAFGFTIIDFNVIYVLGFSTLFYCFVEKRSWKILLASLLGWFLLSWYVMDILRVSLPKLTDPQYTIVAFNLGANFSNVGDWMPLTPYICAFFIGAIVTYFVYATKKSKFKRHEWERPICFLGRHTFIVYLAHMPVLALIFMIINAIFKGCI